MCDHPLGGNRHLNVWVSLTATILRRRITGALQSLKTSAIRAVNHNTLYLYPTVELLTAFLVHVALHPNGTRTAGSSDPVAAIEEMIKKYGFTSSLESNSSTTTVDGGPGTADRNIVVLLTGSTGCLGSQVLENLLLNSGIGRVYTFNRQSPSSKSQLERHLDRFRDKGLDLGALQSNKWIPLEGDLTKKDLGLSESVYKKVRFAIIFSQCFFTFDLHF